MKKLNFVLPTLFPFMSFAQLPVTDVGSQTLISAQTAQQAQNFAETMLKFLILIQGSITPDSNCSLTISNLLSFISKGNAFNRSFHHCCFLASCFFRKSSASKSP